VTARPILKAITERQPGPRYDESDVHARCVREGVPGLRDRWGSVSRTVTITTQYHDYEALSVISPGWSLSAIRRLSVRERTHWVKWFDAAEEGAEGSSRWLTGSTGLEDTAPSMGRLLGTAALQSAIDKFEQSVEKLDAATSKMSGGQYSTATAAGRAIWHGPQSTRGWSGTPNGGGSTPNAARVGARLLPLRTVAAAPPNPNQQGGGWCEQRRPRSGRLRPASPRAIWVRHRCVRRLRPQQHGRPDGSRLRLELRAPDDRPGADARPRAPSWATRSSATTRPTARAQR
jgi:hypothetical protein